MHAIQENAAGQWDMVLSELRKSLPGAIAHLKELEAVVAGSVSASAMDPEQWAELCTDLVHYLARDEETGISPEETVRRVSGLVQSALDAGDLLVHFEEF